MKYHWSDEITMWPLWAKYVKKPRLRKNFSALSFYCLINEWPGAIIRINRLRISDESRGNRFVLTSWDFCHTVFSIAIRLIHARETSLMNKLFHTPMTHNAEQSLRCWQFLVSIRTYADFETVRNDLGNSLLTLLLSLCLFDSVRVSSLKFFARNIVKSWLSQRPDDEWNLKKSDPALVRFFSAKFSSENSF